MTRSITTLLFALAAGCAGATTTPGEPPPTAPEPTETGRRYISIGADAIETAREIAAAHGTTIDVLETADGVAVIGFEAAQFRELSEAMHEVHKRCGGFVLHDTIDEARIALRARANEGLVQLSANYALDDAATVQAVLPTLDQTRILESIEQLSAMHNRYYTSATGAAASTWLRDRWRAYSDRSDVTIELVDHGFPQKSVLLRIPGATRPDQVVVIGGHLDSIASGGSTGHAPGADDDASGIATLSEVARALLAKDYRPARTIELIAYAAEEVGLRGSQAIARDHQTRGVDVVGVLQLDMTNYQGSDKDIWLMQDYTNAAQNTFVTNLIDTYVGATWGVDSCGYGCSDHASWHNAGYPASMPFESRMTEYNPAIHTSDDTLEMSDHNAQHALKFAKLATAFAIELGGGSLGPSTNTPPTVRVTAPTAGTSVPAGTAVQLTATASDVEDGDLGSRIAWISSKDGALGSGASRSVTLSPGSHTITATVRDSAQAPAQASVTVDVTQASTALFADDFEGASTWAATGLWHVATSSSCAAPGYSSPTRAMYFGKDAGCTYDTGSRTQGSMTSPTISGITSTSTLRFKHFRKVEKASGTYDVTSVAVVVGGASTTVWSQSSTTTSQAAWVDSGEIALGAYAGKSIQLRFAFDSKDSYANAFTGWLVDDVVVSR